MTALSPIQTTWQTVNGKINEYIGVSLIVTAAMGWFGARFIGPGAGIADVKQLIIQEVQARNYHDTIIEQRLTADEKAYQASVDSELVHRADTQEILRGLLVLTCDSKPLATLQYLNMASRCARAKAGQ